MTFCFQGSPGTGKTTVARRMGLLFEALGVLPSAEVVQVSASDFVTGYVGQAAKKTRDILRVREVLFCSWTKLIDCTTRPEGRTSRRPSTRS